MGGGGAAAAALQPPRLAAQWLGGGSGRRVQTTGASRSARKTAGRFLTHAGPAECLPQGLPKVPMPVLPYSTVQVVPRARKQTPARSHVSSVQNAARSAAHATASKV